jgi:hypothetical protein
LERGTKFAHASLVEAPEGRKIESKLPRVGDCSSDVFDRLLQRPEISGDADRKQMRQSRHLRELSQSQPISLAP